MTQSARLGIIDDVPRPARIRDFLVCLSPNLFVGEVQDVVARLLLEHPWSALFYYGHSAVVHNITQVGHVVQKVLGASVGTARGCLVALGGLVFSPRWVGKVQKGGLAAIMFIRVTNSMLFQQLFFRRHQQRLKILLCGRVVHSKEWQVADGICEHEKETYDRQDEQEDTYGHERDEGEFLAHDRSVPSCLR